MDQPFQLDIRIPISTPFKRRELNDMVSFLDAYSKEHGNYSVNLQEYHYKEHRGANIGQFLQIILSGVADIVTIVLGLKELVKKTPRIKEISIRVENKEIIIRGDIADSELVKLVKEAGKING